MWRLRKKGYRAFGKAEEIKQDIKIMPVDGSQYRNIMKWGKTEPLDTESFVLSESHQTQRGASKVIPLCRH